MSLVINLFLILVISIILIVILIYTNKSLKNDKLETCFSNCNKNCDNHNSAAYFDLCKKKCAINCGHNFN